MANAAPTASGTQVPAPGPGFPPFKTETFPSQLFWLAITFAVLFVVLWRMAGPRIHGAISARKARISDDLGIAEKHRNDAEAASAAYQSALAAARGRAQALAEDNRKRIAGDIDDAKAKADAEAHAAMARAEAAIAASREAARGHITRAAQDAAADIVMRLIGESVSADDAAKAVAAAGGS